MNWFAFIVLLITCVHNGYAQSNTAKNNLVNKLIKKVIEGKLTIPLTSINSKTASAFMQIDSVNKLSSDYNPKVLEGEPFIVQDPNRPNTIVVSYMRWDSLGLSFPTYYSTDYGDTWHHSSFDTRDVLANDFPNYTPAGGGDPVLAFDDNGKLYFTWIYAVHNPFKDRTEIYMYWAESFDNGKTFKISQNGDQYIGFGAFDSLGSNPKLSNFGDGLYDRPWIAVDRSGGPNHNTLYLACLFIPNDSTSYNSFGTILKYKKPDKNYFENHQIQISDFFPGQYNNIAIDKSGTIHIIYADLIAKQIIYKKSTNAGQSFSNSKHVSTFIPVSSSQYTVNDLPHPRVASSPSLSVSANGDTYVSWVSFDNDVIRSYFSKKSTSSTTWDTVISLNSLANIDDGITIMPSVAASSGGNSLSILWYNVSKDHDSAYYSYMESLNAGDSFSAPLQISSKLTDFSSYNIETFFGDYFTTIRDSTYTYVVWSDGRNPHGPKVYFSRIKSGTITHITEIKESVVNALRVWPIPATKYLYLDFNLRSDTNLKITIIDLAGKQLLQQTTSVLSGKSTLSLDVSSMQPATYLVVVEGTNIYEVRKVIVAN